LAWLVCFLDDGHSDWGETKSQYSFFFLHFFRAKDVEHFFMCLLAIYTSFESYLFNSFFHLLIELFVLLVFNFWSSLYILNINPMSTE
jgi:hypothetical protein